MDEKDREIQKTREYNYVLWTVIVVLAIMVVNLFAQKTCNNETFVNQVSFASTISSIILSVIAIIMTVVSNDSINNLLHKFRDLSDDLRNVPEKFSNIVGSLQISSSKLEKLNDSVASLPSNITKANEQIDRLSKMLDKAIQTINSIERNTLEVNQKLRTAGLNMFNSSDVENRQLMTRNQIFNFSSNLPSGPIHVLKIFIIAFQMKKIVDLNSLGERLFGTAEYIIGILAICRALGLVELDIIDYRGTIVAFKNVDHNLIEAIDNAIKEFDKKTDDYINMVLLEEIKKIISECTTVSHE